MEQLSYRTYMWRFINIRDRIKSMKFTKKH